MTSVIAIATGITLLAASLATRNEDMMFTAAITGWLGAILVIVGTGKLFFLDER
jgi:hypothetical protein